MISAGDFYNITVEIKRGFYLVGDGRGIKLYVAYYVTVRKLDNAVGILLGKLAVVGNHNYKLCFGKLFKGIENLTSRYRIKRARRLVRHDYFGLFNKRSGNRHPLLLSAR